MPRAVKCKRLGCTGVAIEDGYCDTHKPLPSPVNPLGPVRVRPTYHSLYNTRQWRALRTSALANNPVCVRCLSFNITVAATEVDHVVPHRGDKDLFLDPGNLQCLCPSCHSWKTNQENKGVAGDRLRF